MATDSIRSGELLQQLGLSRNEARAYLALLGCQPATAYEIARQSAIPTSKIYETVNRLVSRGVFQPTGNEDEAGKQYVALPPSEFTRLAREATETHANELLPLLEAITQPASTDFIWPLASEDDVILRSRGLVDAARDWVLVSAWAQELVWLAPSLEAAQSRGIKIALVHFGKPTVQIGATYHHPVEKTLYNEKGGRGLTLVVDSDAVVIANFREDGHIDGAWSHNQSFVTVAEDYVKHDVYITKVTRFLNDPLVARFGSEYERLRDVFNADA